MVASKCLQIKFLQCSGCGALVGCEMYGVSYQCIECDTKTHSWCLDDFSAGNSKDGFVCVGCENRNYKVGTMPTVLL